MHLVWTSHCIHYWHKFLLEISIKVSNPSLRHVSSFFHLQSSCPWPIVTQISININLWRPCFSSVEPDASKTVQDCCLHESNPTRMQLHDHSKRTRLKSTMKDKFDLPIRAKDDIINHRSVICNPESILCSNRFRSMKPNDSSPRSNKHSTLNSN